MSRSYSKRARRARKTGLVHTKPPAALTWRRGRESRDGGCRKQVGVAGCGLLGAHTGQGGGDLPGNQSGRKTQQWQRPHSVGACERRLDVTAEKGSKLKHRSQESVPTECQKPRRKGGDTHGGRGGIIQDRRSHEWESGCKTRLQEVRLSGT